MENLSDLKLDISYRSDVGNVVSDFYVPYLSRSVLYRRAAGYFTSQGPSLVAKGLAHLVKNNGKIRLVISPALSEGDIQDISTGYRTRDDIFRAAMERGLQNTEDELTQSRMLVLTWLISNGAMDVKLAFRVDPVTKKIKRGIYHEKIGVFKDEAGNHVAFTGSQNETEGGLVKNFESIDVFCSWKDSEGRVSRKILRCWQLSQWARRWRYLDS